MARTDKFREQHKKIGDIVKEIQGQLDEKNLTANSKNTVVLLGRLSGVIKLHLAMEDESLYPGLAKSANPKTKYVAEKFITEMGGIAKAYLSYADKWNEKAIRENAKGFITETTGIIKVLGERIQKEESELYPLADAG